MSTVPITRTVVRTSDCAQDVTIEVPAGTTEDQIREALLEKAADMVFSKEHHSEYRLMDEVGEGEGAKAQSDVRWILDELVKLGFHRDECIPGAEVVEVVKTIFDDLTSGVHRPASYEPHFIYSQQEDLFWSNSDGWVDLKGATPFFQRPTSLPVIGGGDVRVVTAEQADVLSRYWAEHVESGPGATA